MGWSINIGRIFGIQFRIHVTFFLLLLFVFFMAGRQGMDAGLRAVLFICAVFVCVLIHELGHSLIARRFGKEAENITLLPIGGVSMMEEMPEKPGQEITMAIIGPFINLAIAGILYLLVGRWSGVSEPNLTPDSAKAFVASLITVNIWLAIFNMIPAFPMDGGRVLRGLAGLFTNFVRATAIAVAVGQALAMGLIFFGILTNWWLALIGFFIYMGAGSEKQQVLVRSLLRQVAARHAMVTEFESLRPDEQLAQVVERVYHGCQDDFPVVGDSGLRGILTRNKLLAAIHEKGLDVPVSDVMTSEFVEVEPATPLEEVYKRLSSADTNAAAVVENGRLVGLIAHDTIGRFLSLRAAIRGLDPSEAPAV